MKVFPFYNQPFPVHFGPSLAPLPPGMPSPSYNLHLKLEVLTYEPSPEHLEDFDTLFRSAKVQGWNVNVLPASALELERYKRFIEIQSSCKVLLHFRNGSIHSFPGWSWEFQEKRGMFSMCKAFDSSILYLQALNLAPSNWRISSVHIETTVTPCFSWSKRMLDTKGKASILLLWYRGGGNWWRRSYSYHHSPPTPWTTHSASALANAVPTEVLRRFEDLNTSVLFAAERRCHHFCNQVWVKEWGTLPMAAFFLTSLLPRPLRRNRHRGSK